MIILQAKSISKSYGVQTIFHNISFAVDQGDKIGLIGTNGAGKTTLFRCLTGEDMPDQGEIYRNEQTSLGYLAQDHQWREDSSLFEDLLLGYEDILEDRKKLREIEKNMSQTSSDQLEGQMQLYAQVTERYERAGGYACEAMVKRVAKGLGFSDEDLSRPVATMSGGEKTRAALAKLLLRTPDILLLDEPTNHLDISAVEWLEEFINQYPKTVIVVSHDRFFLDRTVTKIMEMEQGSLAQFPGNFSGYLQKKAEISESYRKAYEKQQQAIAKTEEFIRRNRAGIKSKQARGRETILNRMDRLEKPQDTSAIKHWDFSRVPECGHQVLEVKDLSHSFGARQVLQNISFTVTNGEKVAILGENGTGKTTILKSVVGEITPDQGEIIQGNRVKASYYSQEHENLNWHHTVLQEIMYSFNKGGEEARTLLGGFLFRGDAVEKKVGDLSGGERSRLALLKLFLEGGNFLILDEPTNHLDIPSKEVVEDCLNGYPGTILLVSHDRYFLDKVVDRILVIEEGNIKDYQGNYSYYKFKKREMLDVAVKDAPVKKSAKVRIETKERERELKKLSRSIQKIEEEISLLEKEKEEMIPEMSKPENFGTAAKQLKERYETLEEKIAQKYQEWDLLTEEEAELKREETK